MWWGGRSAPARFFVPMLFDAGDPGGRRVGGDAPPRHARDGARRAARDGVRLVRAGVRRRRPAGLQRSRRPTPPGWNGSNGATDLAQGLPAWWRGSEGTLFRDIAIWACAIAAAWGAPARRARDAMAADARRALRRDRRGVYAVAAMCAITIVWTLSGAGAVNPTAAQLALLRRLGAERRVLTFELPSWRRLASDAVPAALRIEPLPSTTLGGAGANDRPLYQVPSIPAGQYRLRLRSSGAAGLADGRRRAGPVLDPQRAAGRPAGPDPPRFPRRRPRHRRARRRAGAPIRSRADHRADRHRAARRAPVRRGGAARGALRHLDAVLPRRSQLSGTGSLLDRRSARAPSIVLQPDAPRAIAVLHLRNAPVDNRVRIQAGSWREELALGPGEERRVELPLDIAARRDARHRHGLDRLPSRRPSIRRAATIASWGCGSRWSRTGDDEKTFPGGQAIRRKQKNQNS